MSTFEVGNKLVALCSEGKFLEAIESLYANDIVSVEASGPGDCGDAEAEAAGFAQTMTGIDAIRGKNQWWAENNEVHSCEVKGPFPHGDRFAVLYDMDVTAKAGPMSGQRIQMTEVGLYTVRDGKIAREEFFYAMGG